MRLSKQIIAICVIYCNKNQVLHKPIASDFITMACIVFFVIAITPYYNDIICYYNDFFRCIKFFFSSSCSGTLL